MIDSSELDALVVVMPEDLHHPMVIAGVEAGLHVLCEKPMAFTADRSGGNAGGGRAGAGEAHGAVHQSRAAALPLDQASARDGYIGMPYHAYFTWPTGWYPAQQPNSYFWWADARRAEGAVNELGAHHDRAPTGCCTSARRTSPEPDCDTPDRQW